MENLKKKDEEAANGDTPSFATAGQNNDNKPSFATAGQNNYNSLSLATAGGTAAALLAVLALFFYKKKTPTSKVVNKTAPKQSTRSNESPTWYRNMKDVFGIRLESKKPEGAPPKRRGRKGFVIR